MGVTFYTGRRALLRPRLLEKIQSALALKGDGAVIVMVPEQYTLETEMLTLQGLGLEGSFRLSVLSPKRVCQLIFDEAGRPERMTIDERGRAMLMGKVLRELNRKLKWYQGAKDKRGFEMRIVEEITLFKQAGVTPEMLMELSENQADGALKWKMRDVSMIYSAYEEALSGAFQDGEDEMEEAVKRMEGSSTVRGAAILVFGFDLTTPILNRLIYALSNTAGDMGIFLPLINHPNAPDFTLYQPLLSSYERLVRVFTDGGKAFERVKLEDEEKSAFANRHLAKELFSSPALPFEGKNQSLQLVKLNNPLEEARFAASLTRRLVQKNNWRYSDILVLSDDLSGYIDSLEYAFGAYEVPLFASESRSADRHPLPRFLIESLKIASGDQGDLATILNSGYADITDDEADKLLSYAVRYGLSSRGILKPLKRGDPEAIAQMEDVRKRIAEPIIRLDQALTRAGTLKEQLAAVFLYLSELNCQRKGEIAREALIQLNQRALAAEDAQVWNRVMGVFDQMHDLMGEKKLPKATFTDLIQRAFAASQIKPLPQSSDAVNAVSASRVGAKGVKAIIYVGNAGVKKAADDRLFSQLESDSMSKSFGAYLGMDALGRTRTERMYIKDALSLAESYICITYPMSASDGSSVAPNALIAEVKRIFPNIQERGGVNEDESIVSMRYEAPMAAEISAAAELSEGNLSESGKKALASIARMPSEAIQRLKRALNFKTESESIGSTLARRVYGPLSKVSVTRLEAYAKCPFAHFVKYALRPEVEETFGLNARDEGGFFHEAVRAFLMENREEIHLLSGEEAARRMNRISDDLLEGAIRDVMEDTGVGRATAKKLRRTASRAARMLTEQLRTGAFQPVELEMEFGDTGASLTLSAGENTRLAGRIDRIDIMQEEGEMYLRIVDYKRGKQKLDAAEMYYGLQLQLILYLAEAIRKYGAKSAGAFYFRVDDPVISTESRNEEVIERERSDRMRMDGILPNDTELIKKMADEPERVFKMKFLKKGGLDSKTNAATELQFEMLMNRALDRASHFMTDLREGVTKIEPVRREKTDACQYCEYKGVCMLDKRIPGASVKRIPGMSFQEVYEKLSEDD